MNLVICDRKRVSKVFFSPSLRPLLRGVISIGETPAGWGTPGPWRRLHLFFEDERDPKIPGGPLLEHVLQIQEWSRKLPPKEEEGIIAVHCFAGVSRSSAVGMILARAYFGAEDPRAFIEACRAPTEALGLRPRGLPFSPNPLLLSLAGMPC
jgi:predicted protein tyrosine phosphatase